MRSNAHVQSFGLLGHGRIPSCILGLRWFPPVPFRRFAATGFVSIPNQFPVSFRTHCESCLDAKVALTGRAASRSAGLRLARPVGACLRQCRQPKTVTFRFACAASAHRSSPNPAVGVRIPLRPRSIHRCSITVSLLFQSGACRALSPFVPRREIIDTRQSSGQGDSLK
jgi:hypothetical protein